MTANDVDYYDVQRMIEDARSQIRGEIDRAVRDACTQLRSEITDLRNELADALINRGTLA